MSHEHVWVATDGPVMLCSLCTAVKMVEPKDDQVHGQHIDTVIGAIGWGKR
jgi:hypothetical protein